MNFSAAWQSRLPTRSHVYSTPATWRVWRSAGSFQLLCHSEQPGDGIPVSCSTGVLQGPIQQWRKFRASYAGGKIDVEFAAGDPQFLGIGFGPEERVHLDQMVASNVDATEHRDDHGHSRALPFAYKIISEADDQQRTTVDWFRA